MKMNRIEFLKACGGACLGLMAAATLLEGCAPTHFVHAIESGNGLQVSKAAFILDKKGRKSYRKCIIVRTENMTYPIALYRSADEKYTALLMQCTHQGHELNMNGDILTCSAHGSEFDNQGSVIQGPAELPLSTFKVTADNQNIYLQLGL